ncbi:hypothetical protein BU17DRAFT_64701 [Hysterangium stoloniferum]|nr:hypothetical protein BU17DRAFT_64701 [Hysterangium stoloniferum]
MEMGVQYNMQFLARLGSRLHSTISDFVTLLKDSDENIQSCRLSALAKLSEQGAVGEFPMATANAILDLVALLKDSERYSRSSRVLALAKFSEQGAVGDNGIGIQLRFDDRRILNGHCGCHSRHCCLLEDSDEDVRSGGVLALGKFSEQGAHCVYLWVHSAPIGTQTHFNPRTTTRKTQTRSTTSGDQGNVRKNGGVFYTNGGVFYTNGGVFYTNGGVFYTNGGVFYTNGGVLYENWVGVFYKRVDGPPRAGIDLGGGSTTQIPSS